MFLRRDWSRVVLAAVVALASLLSANAARAAGSSYPAGSLELPSTGQRLVGSTLVQGWAIDVGAKAAGTGTGVDQVQVFLDGSYRASATYGDARSDIGGAYGAQFTSAGFHVQLDLSNVSAGSHTLEARAHSTVTDQITSYTRTVSVAVGYPAGAIDTPAAGSTLVGAANVVGWAMDAGATGTPNGTGVDHVGVYLDGNYRGDAIYGDPRSDVGSAYGAQFTNAGYHYMLDLTNAPGSHTIAVHAHSSITGVDTVTSKSVTVLASYPSGAVEEPAAGSSVYGVVTLRGWSIDMGARTLGSGTGVDSVKVYQDGTYVGDAIYGDARPDIAAAYGSQFTNSAWRFRLDLSSTPLGAHSIEARAHSTITGQSASYTTRLNVVQAPPAATPTPTGYPRGSIDGLSSSNSVAGWALDVGAPAGSGTGVDRVQLYVDGTYMADAVYGDARPDVGAAYGAQFTNSGYHSTLSGVVPGSHTLETRAHSTVTNTVTAYLSVINVGATMQPTPTPVPTSTPAPVPHISGPIQPFGITAHLLWSGLDQANAALDQSAAAGLTRVRFDVAWDSLEPLASGQEDPTYLTKLDGVMNAIWLRGQAPILVVVGTPAWARHNAGTRMTPPDQISDYAAIMGFLARRYSVRSGVAYEIWNEPNSKAFWDTPSGPDATAYAHLLAAASASIRAAAPGAIVLGGSLLGYDHDFLDDMYKLGNVAGTFDALALHPYDGSNAPDSISDPSNSFTLAVQQSEQLMVADGESNKPIWITEMGWSTNTMSDATRATYYQRAVDLVRSWSAFVPVFCAYAQDAGVNLPDYALVDSSGTPTASWSAYTVRAAGG